MKIATWNVNSLRVRLPHVLKWLEREQPDVLALQETKLRDEDFPADAFTDRGYTATFSGQAAYNGVAILARQTPHDVTHGIGNGFVDEQKRVLAATFGALRVYCLYVPNGESVDSDKYRYKLEWLAALKRLLAGELARHPLVVVVGDFNVAPEDRDVHDPRAWAGKVLCSPKERAALGELLTLGFHDTFRLFPQPENTYSWWDYRGASFRRNQGLRIDLVLASRKLSQMCDSCRIDKEPRGWERPSDHVPVIAEFALP
ncbi:MAG TPA: exodeoxyribonuclease III [Gammaproteobacteria bacterium]|nr:exodeoxyribonuclease III [Gammaproteobacteria bacterium]